MSTPSIQIDSIRPHTARYDEALVRHREFVDKWGIVLPHPTQDLLARATTYAKHVQEECHNPSGDNVDANGAPGTNYFYSNRQGQIGAELLADHLRTVCGWDYTRSDPGFDIVTATRTPAYIDAKTRQGFLTLRRSEMKETTEYYALVEQVALDAPYVFCGVIPPRRFMELACVRSLMELQPRIFTYWVGADELKPPAHFHPDKR